MGAGIVSLYRTELYVMTPMLEMITDTADHSRAVLNQLLGDHSDIKPKSFERLWKISEVTDLLQVTPERLRAAETTLELQLPLTKTGRRVGYTLTQLNLLRQHFGKFRGRAPGDPAAVIAATSGKGGCSKTTFSVYLAQKLAIEGYKVLMIDTDPQASCTSLVLGLNPDMHFDADDTIAPFMMGLENEFFSKAIPTGMEGLSIIPCCQPAAIMDLKGTGEAAEVSSFWRLQHALSQVHDYDVVVIDTAPTVTYTNLRSIIAANIIIHPIAPTLLDLSSASGYENTIKDFLSDLLSGDTSLQCNVQSRRYLLARYDHQNLAHRDFAEIIRMTYPVYATPFAELREISNTLNDNGTLYETGQAIGSNRTRQKALDILDNLFTEVIEDIHNLWGTARPASSLKMTAKSRQRAQEVA